MHQDKTYCIVTAATDSYLIWDDGEGDRSARWSGYDNIYEQDAEGGTYFRKTLQAGTYFSLDLSSDILSSHLASSVYRAIEETEAFFYFRDDGQFEEESDVAVQKLQGKATKGTAAGTVSNASTGAYQLATCRQALV